MLPATFAARFRGSRRGPTRTPSCSMISVVCMVVIGHLRFGASIRLQLPSHDPSRRAPERRTLSLLSLTLSLLAPYQAPAVQRRLIRPLEVHDRHPEMSP